MNSSSDDIQGASNPRYGLIAKTTYTIKLIEGACGEYCWIKRAGDWPYGLGSDCGDIYQWHGDHPISGVLQGDFVSWSREYDAAPFDGWYEFKLMNWQGFHQRGLAMAQRLKNELGNDVAVIYIKTDSDPVAEHDSRREIFSDGRMVNLPSLGEIYWWYRNNSLLDA